jgi:hypothetical protein
MKSSENQTQSQDTAAPATEARLSSPARRRLLRAGAIGAPALLALKSTPVMACNCKLPSGFSTSGNASRNASSTACAQPGYKPTTWRYSPYCDSKTGVYQYTTCQKGEKFSKYFSCTGYTDAVLDTCLGADNDHRGMAMAGFLMACSQGGTNYPTKTTIQNIWNQGVCGSGYLVPGTTVTWNRNKCLSYLQYVTGQTPTYG